MHKKSSWLGAMHIADAVLLLREAGKWTTSDTRLLESNLLSSHILGI